eukprot:CFRG7701T1
MSSSNPVAPAGYASMLTGDNDKESEEGTNKLSNADFRKLMMTPAVGSKSSFDSFKAPAAKGTTGASISKKKYKEYYKQKEKEKQEHADKYRDRAAERRKNEDVDDEEVSIGRGDGMNIFGVSDSNATSEEIRKAEIERTRYLGGDVEHTHLVKGLDYALLQKVKADMMNKSGDGDNTGVEEDSEEGERGIKSKNVGKGLDGDSIEVKGTMARNLMRISFDNSRQTKKNGAFIPGRMAYKFVLNSDFGEMESDIPTTILRSAQEMVGKQKITQTTTNDLVIEKLASIFLAVRQGSRSSVAKDSKNKKSGGHGSVNSAGLKSNSVVHSSKKVAAELPKKAIDDDEDIFGDAGRDYSVTLPPKATSSMGPPAAVGPTIHPSRSFLFNSSSTAVSGPAAPPVNSGDNNSIDLRTSIDDNSVTGVYGEDESVTSAYGVEMDMDDEVTAPYGGGDEVTAPYGGYMNDEVTAPYGVHETTKQYDNQNTTNLQQYAQSSQYDHTMPPPPIHHQHKREKNNNIGSEKPGFKIDTEGDSYGEFYPDALSASTLAYDSDEDDQASALAFSQMDKGTAGNKGLISRYDFDDEDAYEKAKGEQEALPKAAFQYGKKMNDGRTTRRQKGVAKMSKDKKLDRDLNMINLLMAKKRKDIPDDTGSSKKAKHS